MKKKSRSWTDLLRENYGLMALRESLMADNRRLERERDNLQTHLDLQEQALADMTEQRDEARKWARRYRKWYQSAIAVLEND